MLRLGPRKRLVTGRRGLRTRPRTPPPGLPKRFASARLGDGGSHARSQLVHQKDTGWDNPHRRGSEGMRHSVRRKGAARGRHRSQTESRTRPAWSAEKARVGATHIAGERRMQPLGPPKRPARGRHRSRTESRTRPPGLPRRHRLGQPTSPRVLGMQPVGPPRGLATERNRL